MMEPFDLDEVEHLDTKHLIYDRVPDQDVGSWVKLLEEIRLGRAWRPPLEERRIF